MPIDEERVRAIVKQEISMVMELTLGLNIEDKKERLIALNHFQALNQSGRIEDFRYLRKLRKDAEQRQAEIKTTFWVIARKVTAPIAVAIAMGIISWFGIHHKSN